MAGSRRLRDDYWQELQSRYGGGRTVHNYKVSYYDSTSEQIRAASFRDIDGEWIEFVDGQKNQLLRLRSNQVLRIEAVTG